MKELMKTEARNLNLRMELFTYFGGVPLGAFFFNTKS